MTAEKIKISSNEMIISDQQDNITRTVKIMNDVLGIWKENGIKLTDAEINSLIRSAFGNITIEKIASERSAKLRPRQQVEEYTSWVDDIKLAFKLYPGLALLPFSQYVYCNKGEIFVKENAFEEIEERYSYFITDKKDIELHHRHKKLIEDLNQLSEDLRKNTGNIVLTSAWLVKHNVDGSAYAPNTFMYGK